MITISKFKNGIDDGSSLRYNPGTRPPLSGGATSRSSVGSSTALLMLGSRDHTPPRRPCVPIAQLAEAIDLGSIQWGFKSLWAYHNVGVWPSGKAYDFDSYMRRFNPYHPSHLSQWCNRRDTADLKSATIDTLGVRISSAAPTCCFRNNHVAGFHAAHPIRRERNASDSSGP